MRPGILPERFEHKGNDYATLPWFGTKMAQKYAKRDQKKKSSTQVFVATTWNPTFSTSGQRHSRPQSHDPSDLRQGSRALAGPDFLNMCRVFVSYSQPIRFARLVGKSVNRGLPVLDKARALFPRRRSEWSCALGTRMEQRKVTTCCTCAVMSRKKCHVSSCRRQVGDICRLRYLVSRYRVAGKCF